MAIRTWILHNGEIFVAPADARTCHDATGKPLVHYLWIPQDAPILLPHTRCGQRAGAIPGDRDVNCADCLAIEQHEANVN